MNIVQIFMSCTRPLLAVNTGIDPQTGKMRLKFLPRKSENAYRHWSFVYGAENVLQLPCGKCESCIEKRTLSWAARCVLEASLYEQNSFVTLTYRESCLPKGGLCKKDLQNFIRKLRRAGYDIRYFAAGEYGSNTFRPHYHLIIFNYFPKDAAFLCSSKYGGNLWRSKELESLWSFGHVVVGEVSYASCGYVARYCMKKQKRPGIAGEFSLMSLKPGIGFRYFESHKSDIYDTDKIYFDFGKRNFIKPVKYFDKIMESIDPAKVEELKNIRVSASKTFVASELLRLGFDAVEKLYAYNDALKKINFDKLKRRI